LTVLRAAEDFIEASEPVRRRLEREEAAHAALAVASRVRRRSELMPIFGDGLKDPAAAVWA